VRDARASRSWVHRRTPAEGGGFEPPKRGSPACWFSRPVHSTALPPFPARITRRLVDRCRGAGCIGKAHGARGQPLNSERLGRGGRVAEGTRLLSEYGVTTPSRVRIPPSPLRLAVPLRGAGGRVAGEPAQPARDARRRSRARAARTSSPAPRMRRVAGRAAVSVVAVEPIIGGGPAGACTRSATGRIARVDDGDVASGRQPKPTESNSRNRLSGHATTVGYGRVPNSNIQGQ
jgi:hypothetical protein